MFLNFFLQSSTVVSDTVSKVAVNTIAAPSTTDTVSYLDFILKGGIMIIPIIILLFFCIYVIVERYLSIKKTTKQDENMINDVRIQLKSGKIDNAIMMCGRGNTASGNIIKSGISIIGRPISEIESVMEIVIDGLSKEDIDKAMRVGIQAVCDLGAANGIKRISAGNYGGKLGPFHFHLQEIMA